MKKIEFAARGVCWLFWALVYVVGAAWVGEGHFSDVSIRAGAAIGGALWLWIGILAIELTETPKAICKAIEEDIYS